ncbi:A24 family peptidase [Parasphingorhabdus sp.]|uniref:prepilin peptidase n=1 Tax=Parasphingorhabdus sp. TaxID=2709688 RepID=UPI00326703D3
MPPFAFPLAGIVAGLIIGSFMATISVRWPQGISVVNGRSHCDICDRELRYFELIPLLSYVFQSGKCRECESPINPEHPAIELAAAVIGGVALFVAPSLTGVVGAIFGWQLLLLAVLDVKHHWLPDKLTYMLIISGVLAALALDVPDFGDRIIGGVAGFGSLFVIAVTYKYIRKRDGLGAGDAKLLAGIGCWLGWMVLPLVVLMASLVGIVAATLLLMRQRKVLADTALPFGSYLAIAAFPIWVLGNAMPVERVIQGLVW